MALGVGAAALGGSAVAWADGPSSGSTPSPAASSAKRDGPDGSARAARHAASPPSSPAAARTSHSGGLAQATAAPSATVSPVAIPTANTSEPQPTAGPPPATADPAATTVVAPIDGLASASPTVAAAPAPAPAVTGLVTRVLDAVLDPSAAGGPVLPVDSPLDWTLLAFARRGSAAALGAIPSAHDIAAPAATASTGLVMGPSGVPIPSQTYVTNVMKLYVTPNSPAGTQALVVFTPEGLYPITGVKSLPLNTSVDQGGEILSETLAAQIGLGNRATIFGYSQSAIIASLLAENLDPSVPVNLVLVGNEMNPNGGFLSRFPNLTMPSLGIDFYGATPNNTVPVTNYTLEYDGFADFPKYPLNFLADLNAGLGIVFVHTKYADLNQAQVRIMRFR